MRFTLLLTPVERLVRQFAVFIDFTVQRLLDLRALVKRCCRKLAVAAWRKQQAASHAHRGCAMWAWHPTEIQELTTR